MQKTAVHAIEHFQRIPTKSHSSPSQERKLKDVHTTPTHKDDSLIGKNTPTKSVSENKNPTTQKSIAWKICHTKPSSRAPVRHYLVQPDVTVTEDTPLLDLLIIEAFMNINATIRSNIFSSAYSQNAKWQQAQWYHDKGPLFSALRLFHAWMKSGKCPLWCKTNSVNLGAMHSFLEQCQSQLDSIRSVLARENLPAKIDDLPFNLSSTENEEKIYDTLLDVHGKNMYIFSGVSKIGYFSVTNRYWDRIDITKSFGFNLLGKAPKYAITIKSPKGNIVGVVWLDAEPSATAVLSKHFNCTLSDVTKHALLETTKIGGIGQETKKRLLYELKKLIPAEGVFFTSSPYERGISIHTSNEHMKDIIKTIALNIVKEVKQEFSRLWIEIPRQDTKENIFMTVRDGLVCENVSKGISRPILRKSGYESKLADIRKQFRGAHVFTTYNDENVECCFISCANTNQADACAKTTPLQNIDRPYRLKALSDITHADINFVQPVRATVHLRQPKSTSTKQTMSALHSLVCKSLGRYSASQINALVTTVQEYRPNEELLVVMIKTTRLFQRSLYLFNCLSSRSINDRSITFADRNQLEKQLCTLEVILPTEIYHVINSNLKRLLAALDAKKPDGWFKTATTDTGMTHMFIKSSSRAVMHQILEMTRAYARPEIVDPCILEFLQTEEGHVYLQHIMLTSGTYITYDIRDRFVHIFGPPTRQQLAKSALEGAEKNPWRICRIGDENHDVTISTFLKEIAPKYEPQTKTLNAFDAISEISLGGSHIFYKTKIPCSNSMAHVLGLRQDSPDIRSHSLQPHFTYEKFDFHSEECASCLSVLPRACLYTLEGCGHNYCASCVQLQVKTSVQNVIFPLLCVGCNSNITLIDISVFLKIINSTDAELLLKRSAMAKTCQNPERFLECPTGLCDGIVFIPVGDSTETEPSCCKCKTPICRECRTPTHNGITCKDNQEVLYSWQMTDPNNHKLCPSCRMGIQKNGGCNNVSCRTCNKHICWTCLEYFDTEDNCYKHLRLAHGGYM